jgi:DnaJ-class molecular chaperone
MRKCFFCLGLICFTFFVLSLFACETIGDIASAMYSSSSGSSSSSSVSGGSSSSWVRCRFCSGTGFRPCYEVNGTCYAGVRDKYCSSCGDRGQVICNVCNGIGEVQR